MFIYTTSFEGISAFTTARKAIESQIGGGWADVTEYSKIAPGSDWTPTYIEVTKENVSKIITFVNTKGRVDIIHSQENPEEANGHTDRTEINKVQVR